MNSLSFDAIYISVSRLYGPLRCTINGLLVAMSLVFGTLGMGHAQAETTILALGDSLTAGYGLSKAESFPNKLQAALTEAGHDARVVNGGVSGDTSKGGLSRVDWLFADKPDLMILELGANDGLRGLPPSETRKNLAAIIEKAQNNGVDLSEQLVRRYLHLVRLLKSKKKEMNRPGAFSINRKKKSSRLGKDYNK